MSLHEPTCCMQCVWCEYYFVLNAAEEEEEEEKKRKTESA